MTSRALPTVGSDPLLEALDRYAFARRFIANAQAGVVLVVGRVAVGARTLPVLASLVLLMIGALCWRKGGWSYRRTLKIWRRNPKAAKRDLAWMKPLLRLVGRS